MAESPQVLGGRFQRLALLKQELGVETLLASDLLNGGHVVLKSARASALPAAAHERALHHAYLLAEAQCPFLASPLAVGQHDGLVYVATRFVPGEPLAQRLLRGPLGTSAALAVGRCLLGALQETHARGVLHRGLSTSCVIVAEEPDARATLIGFGLSRGASLGSALRRPQLQDVLYQSPEQSGAIGRRVDESADLYSAGVVLYECLAGRNPFRADTIGEVLRRHLSVAPLPLRGLGIAVPRALDELLQRLLRKDPRERYQSASGALQDLEDIAAAWEAGGLESRVIVGARDVRRDLAEPAFVGREGELATLEKALDRAAGGEGSLLLVEAESGGGKTRLLDELAERALLRSAWVLRGGCIDRGAPLPYQLFDGIARSVSEACESEPGLGARLSAQLGHERDAVCDVFPELSAALGLQAPVPPAPEEVRQARAPRAVAALLRSLGTEARPAVVLLDDLQWGSERSAQVLDQLLLPRPGSHHLLVVGAARSEEVEAAHWLRRIPSPHRLVLQRLSTAEVRDLVASMAGPLPAEALAEVERLGTGNPFLCSAVLRGLVETEALAFGSGGWRVEQEALRHTQASNEAGILLARRLDTLPPDALGLLGAGALLGKVFDLSLAAELSGLGLARSLAALDAGRGRHLLWPCPDEGFCALVHDKVREALLLRLSPEARQALHLRAAELYEKRPGDQSFALAYHFDAAGQPGRALPHALAAAEQARARSAFETALRYYRIAEAGAVQEGPAARLRVAEALCHVLAIRGCFDEAALQLQSALSLVESREDRVRLQRLLGEIHFRSGAQGAAGRVLGSALRALGIWVPEGRAGMVVALLGLGVAHLWRAVSRRLFGERVRPRAPERQQLAMELCSQLAITAVLERGPLPALVAGMRALSVAERFEAQPASVAHAYAAYALTLSMLPWMDRALYFAARGAEIARKLGDPHVDARNAHGYAVLLSFAGQYAESVAIDRRIVPILEKLGDVTYAGYARGRIGVNLYYQGQLREAAAIAESFHRQGGEASDTQAHSQMLEYWSKATLGRIPARAVAAARARYKAPQELVSAAMAEGIRLLAECRPAAAASEFRQADRLVEEAKLRGHYAGNRAVWLATALRHEAEELPPHAQARRATLMREASAACREGLKVARSFPSSLPHALRELGYVEAWRCRPDRARKALDRSLKVASERGMLAEHARSLLARGEVGLWLGWPFAADELREGTEGLRALGAEPLSTRRRPGDGEEVTVSLLDRFEQVLSAGRSIASALSANAVHAAMLDAGTRLLRADSCLVLDAAPPHRVLASTPWASAPTEAALALADQALKSGRAVVALQQPDRSFTARSALAAPVLAHGAPVCCLFTSSNRVQGLFGEEDERLAGFIAALAGAALENAEHLAAREVAEGEVRHLTESAIRGQEEERRRLSLALHDGAGQVLTAVLLQLDALDPADAQGVALRLAGMSKLIKALLEDLRGLTHDLRPAALDQLGLPAALLELAKAGSAGDLTVEFHADPPGILTPPDVSIAFFRIAQAAMGNLSRHAAATHATISLTERAGALRLEIADDGRGFDPSANASAGIGLIGMRERAIWLGGSCRIESAPGRGTRVLVEVPSPPAGK